MIYDQGVYKKDWALDFDPRNPVRAVEFLRSHGIRGNVLTNDNLGGYLLWQAYPDLKPFVDGRQINKELFARYAQVMRQGPEKHWDQLEKDYQLNIVILDMSFSGYYRLASYIFSQDRWQLVFVDGRCLVFVRKGIFEFSADVEGLDARLREVPLSQEQIIEVLGLSMMPVSDFSKQKFGRTLAHYVSGLEEGLALFGVGFKGEGIRRIVGASAVNPAKTREACLMVRKVLSQ